MIKRSKETFIAEKWNAKANRKFKIMSQCKSIITFLTMVFERYLNKGFKYEMCYKDITDYMQKHLLGLMLRKR